MSVLPMSIPMSYYIDIVSSQGGKSVVQGRKMILRVYTNNPLLETEKHKELFSVDEVSAYFGLNSEEYLRALHYFNYISKLGRRAPSMDFYYVDDTSGDTLLASFIASIADENNFYSFVFARTVDNVNIEAISQQNNAYNFKYLYLVPATINTYTAILADVGAMQGCCVTIGTNTGGDFAEQITGEVIACIDYTDNKPSIADPMFKNNTLSSASVGDVIVARTLDEKNINYVAQMKDSGSIVNLFQRGNNTDGVASLIHANESWIKSKIATNWFNLASSQDIIPANEHGLNVIRRSVIMDVVDQAITVGAISIGNQFDAIQQEYIMTVTNVFDQTNIKKLQQNGFWLDIQLKNRLTSGGAKEYYADYKLLYATSSAIRFVSGSDILM